MIKKATKLFDICESKIESVCDQLFMNVGYLLNYEKIMNEVRIKAEKTKEEFEALENSINVEEFKKFLISPQVNDLVGNYAIYLLTLTTTKVTPKKEILEDDVICYLTSVIENNFSDLSNEESIVAIKRFFELLFEICSEEISDSIYSDLLEDGKILRHSIIHEQFNEKRLFGKIVEKINAEIEQEFVPRDLKYEKIKVNYTKALKQYFQNGFIYLLGEYKFNEFYIPPILIAGNTNRIFRRSVFSFARENLDKAREQWKHILDSKDIIYVVGGAGYGKSLFLKNLINNYTKLCMSSSQDYLVIYCDLKTYYTNGNPNKKTMVDFFQESMINTLGTENITKEFIQYYLGIGRCLVLLDALDEVPKDVRGDLHKKILAFFAICNPSNKVCITSRDRGFLPQQDIEVLEILPLTDNDINDYIDKMIGLKKFKRSDKETFMKQAEALIRKGFLNNFLVLSLLVNIYKAEKELPENKIDLYKKCFEYIAKKREEEKSKTGYNWNNIYPLMKDSTFISLSVLAAPNNNDILREDVESLLLRQYRTKYPDEITAEQAINEFLEFCSNRTELFVPSSTDDKYKFFHRSFFEYFYSRYIHQQPNVEQMYELMSKFDIDSEVFELSVALVKEDQEEKYQKLIEYIFRMVTEDFNTPNWNGTAFGILTLAMQVIDDAYFIQNYYKLVIEYSSLMAMSKISHLNQGLMCVWIEKAVGDSEEKKHEFVKAFEKYSLVYLLKTLSEVNAVKVDTEVVRLGHRLFIENEDELNFEMEFHADIPIRNVPFYVSLYNEYGGLYDLMERSVSLSFNNLLNRFDVQGGKKIKSVLKKGYNNYKKLSIGQKEALLKLVAKLKK